MKAFLYLVLGATQALIVQDWIRVRLIHDTEHRALVAAYALDDQNTRNNGQCVHALSTCETLVEAQSQQLEKRIWDPQTLRASGGQAGPSSKLASAD
jgi:hypothetical protein